MATGDAFTDGQVREISRVTAAATGETGLHFSVYVGGISGDPRSYAERLHAALGPAVAPRAVLMCVAPEERRLEIVTGKEAARRVDDRSCALAAMSMATSFGGGDLAGGVLTGVRMLAEAAGRTRAISA